MRPRAGFTLLEVVLAASLFVLGMSMVLGVFNFGSALTRTAELRSLGADAVDAIAHDLTETLFPLRPDGVAGEPVDIEDREVPGHPGLRYSVETRPNVDSLETVPGDGPPLATEYLVTIRVEWRSRGVKREAEWTTIMLREVPFGARMRRLFYGADPAGNGGGGL